MRTRAVLAGSVAIAAALFSGHASLAAAAEPTVTGKVTGKLPRSSRAATEIRAFEAGAARVVAAAPVSRTGAFKLVLPPGGYVLMAGITPARGRSGAVRCGAAQDGPAAPRTSPPTSPPGRWPSTRSPPSRPGPTPAVRSAGTPTRQAITGGIQDQGEGWNNTLELRVRTVRVERL